MGILEQFQPEGKVALVTGMGRGLGQAMTLGLAEAGADIAGLYRTQLSGDAGPGRGAGPAIPAHSM